MMKDKIQNWYGVAEKHKLTTKIKPDKNFKSHHIPPCKMIGIIGSTGAGKTTSVVEFLHRKNSAFYEIIYFSGSTEDEPLIQLLKQSIVGIQVMSNADDLPELTDYNEKEKNTEKLLICDDFINCSKSVMVKLQKWVNSSRKYGFSVLLLAQNHSNINIQIRRNIHMYWLFRLSDNNTINNIIRTHNVSNVPKEIIKKMYLDATKEKGNFFLIDVICANDDKTKYRCNFLNFLNPSDYI